MKQLITIIFLCIGAFTANAQVALQMEKVGKVATTKIYAGEEITYQLAGEKEWNVGIIRELRYEESLIVFQNSYVELKDITALKSYASGKWSKPVGVQLMIFGASWSAYSGIAAIFDKEDPYAKHDAIVTASGIVLGYGITQIFKSRVFKFGKRRRLRIVDLNPF